MAGAGLTDILEHSGVSRRTVYLNFPNGKPEMVAESTRMAGSWISGQIRQHCDTTADPRSALAGFVERWRRLLEDHDFEAGCPIVASALARQVAPDATDAAATAFAEWQQILGATLVRHAVPDQRASSLASTIIAAVEGAVVMGVAQRSVEALDHVEADLALLLDATVVRPAGT